VQVLIINLLGLAFAATFTVLMLGLAILTLVLLVGMLLLVQPLLLIPVRVTALAFNHRDLVGIVLARAMVHSFQLVLSKDSGADIT